MRNIYGFVLVSLFASGVFAQTVNPKDLVEVTGDANQKCVEYYEYNSKEYCSTKPLLNTKVDPDLVQHEKQRIVFDDRVWQAAWGKFDDSSAMIEYIPAGEDINDWHELITSQFFAGLQKKVSPKQFAEIMITQMKDAGYSPVIKFWQVTDDQVVFEFRILSPANQVQDELQQITKGSDGLYVLHYVTKQTDMGQAVREKWLNNFSQSSIK